MRAADRDDLALLTDALRNAGAIAMGFHGKQPKHWHKPDGSTVTEADIAVDDYLKQLFRAARPDDGWLSEETPDTPIRLQHSRVWIADPIDGTKAYLNGKREWCIGVALIENGVLAVSGLYCPTDNVLFHAVAGSGSYRDGVRLDATTASDTREVISPRSFSSGLAEQNFAPLVGSSLPLLMRFSGIAEHRFAGAVSIGNKYDWDLAAGHLILAEAGGIITDQKGNAIVYNKPNPWQHGLVAATPQWHKTILETVRHS